jgi:hypothetical protein
VKATVTFEIEKAEELVALGQFFDQFGFNAGPVVEGTTAKPAGKPGRKPAKAADPKPEEKPVEEPAVDLGLGDDEPVAEEITKATVAAELRTFIKAKGEKEGPTLALAVLKQFGANKFDELKGEDYAKFLSKLKQAG